MSQLFSEENNRYKNFFFEIGELWLDLSRNPLSVKDFECLFDLVAVSGVEDSREKMFAGLNVNFTEQKPALHCFLRAYPRLGCTYQKVFTSGDLNSPLSLALNPRNLSEIQADIQEALIRMGSFSESVRDGSWKGGTGRFITDILHIGTGGSSLGPALACNALSEYGHSRLRCHFISNSDSTSWKEITRDLNPETTLIIVVSKSWKTQETQRNARAAKRWMAASLSDYQQTQHWVAITANPQAAVQDFGISEKLLFTFPEGVGGRFSLWSSVGLTLMIFVGAQCFNEMLAGAKEVDKHFASMNNESNAPVALALISLWNSLALKSGTEVVVPYRDSLSKLPLYLQQLQMESNGKNIDENGSAVNYATAPAIWGGVGTDAQHSFFQALHQGTTIYHTDFIIITKLDSDPENRDTYLMANALAQSEALLTGHLGNTISSKYVSPHQLCPGNRPCNIIGMSELTPKNFGSLLALYEHKTSILGWLWRVNPFDQWGVELAKSVADQIEPLLLDPIAKNKKRDQISTSCAVFSNPSLPNHLYVDPKKDFDRSNDANISLSMSFSPAFDSLIKKIQSKIIFKENLHSKKS